jgi:hypothetical protein
MVGATGLEQPSKVQQNRRSLPEAAQKAAHSSGPVEPAPDVLDLARRLAALPEAARQALAALLGQR